MLITVEISHSQVQDFIEEVLNPAKARITNIEKPISSDFLKIDDDMELITFETNSNG